MHFRLSVQSPISHVGPKRVIRRIDRTEGQYQQMFAAEALLSEQRRALIALLERDLALGHRRLAMRHYLMLLCRRHKIPQHLHIAMEQLEPAFSRSDLASIEMSVMEWSRMIGPL